MCVFSESVKDISGLTAYEDRKLPTWMAERLRHYNCNGTQAVMTDAELIDTFVRDSWLGHWGAAIVGGEEVAVFEHIGNHHLGFEEVSELAAEMNCGFVLVEPSDLYDVGCTTYLTEKPLMAARKAASLELVNRD